MKWVEQGGKPSKSFYNLEKTNYEKTLVREVKLGNEDSNALKVNKVIEDFYRKIYTTKIDAVIDNRTSEQTISLSTLLKISPSLSLTMVS